MSDVIPSGFAQVAITIKADEAARPAVITLGINYSSGINPAPVLGDVLASLLHAGSLFELSAVMDDIAIIQSYILANQGGFMFSFTDTSEFRGTQATSVSVPMSTTVKIAKRTTLAGRRYRGLMQFPPCTFNAAAIDTGGVLDTTTHTNMQNRANVFYNTLLVNGVQPYLLHAPSVHSATPAPTIIDSFLVGRSIGTNRRRIRQ